MPRRTLPPTDLERRPSLILPAGALYALALIGAAFGAHLAVDLLRRRATVAARALALTGGAAAAALALAGWMPVGVLMLCALPAAEAPLDLRAYALSGLVALIAAAAACRDLAAAASRRVARPWRAALWLATGWLLTLYLAIAALPSPVWSTGAAPGRPESMLWAVGAAAAMSQLAAAALRQAGGARRALQASAAATMAVGLAGLQGWFGTGPIDTLPPPAGPAVDGTPIGLALAAALVLLLVLAQVSGWLGSQLDAQARDIAASLQRANTQLQQANAELVRRAFVDPLTGLPNRALLDDRLGRAAVHRARARATSDAPPARPAVLFIDLDGFKPVNDAYGHAAGDELLQAIAARLQSLCRAVDTLARLGGDEFVILIERVDDVSEAIAVAERVRVAMRPPYDLQGRRLTLSCSIGIAVSPAQGSTERLIAEADLAMYVAKQAGGGSWRVFEPSMEDGVVDQLELQQALREALAASSFHLHYQPKVEAATGRLCGVEALLRWDHPERGAISPARFVPVAERFGLIVPLGAWVIDEACRQIAVWRAAGRWLPVAVNLSGYQLRQPDLVELIAQTLARHGVPAELLVLEITESVVMDGGPAARAMLDALAARGLKLSIDDFGTGHSSLASLRQLRAHELKIDRGFVRDVADDADARAVVDAVVRLAHALGLRVVAEGVETSAQHETMLALGCDELQGFHFGRPVPAAALPEDGALLPGPEGGQPRAALRRVA